MLKRAQGFVIEHQTLLLYLSEFFISFLLSGSMVVYATPYWAHVSSYKELLCHSKWGTIAPSSTNQNEAILETKTYKGCILGSPHFPKDNILKHRCQYFLTSDGYITPAEKSFQTIVILSIGALLFVFLLRFLTPIACYVCKRGLSERDSFWLRQSILLISSLALTTCIPLWYLHFDEVCVESVDEEYLGKTAIYMTDSWLYVIFFTGILLHTLIFVIVSRGKCLWNYPHEIYFGVISIYCVSMFLCLCVFAINGNAKRLTLVYTFFLLYYIPRQLIQFHLSFYGESGNEGIERTSEDKGFGHLKEELGDDIVSSYRDVQSLASVIHPKAEIVMEGVEAVGEKGIKESKGEKEIKGEVDVEEVEIEVDVKEEIIE